MKFYGVKTEPNKQKSESYKKKFWKILTGYLRVNIRIIDLIKRKPEPFLNLRSELISKLRTRAVPFQAPLSL